MNTAAKIITGTILIYIFSATALALWNCDLFFTLSASITLALLVIGYWICISITMGRPCPSPLKFIVACIIVNAITYIFLINVFELTRGY